MAEERVHRRLVAILAADVVGYSRLMEQDETGTLARLRSLRSDVFDPMTKQFDGRIFKNTGDGALAEFGSAVDAVQCAVQIQRAIAERNADQPEESRIVLRIGISLGDVIVDGDDLYGNGVNVAARMESLAESGAICISGNVHEHVGNALDVPFDDLGEQEIKNIARPVRAYQIVLAAPMKQDTEAEAMFRRPAVAVLPFENMSGDAEQEHFADGLTEDIITTLSLWRSFPVIARNSTFAFKGQSPDIREVASRLGARYVIEGSVRRAGDRIRINVQLIDAQTGHHVWAEKFDRQLDDIFDLQDEITGKIVATVEPELARVEYDRTLNRQTENLAAWELYAQGSVLVYSRTRDGHLRARELLEAATRLDPHFSRAFAMLGMTYHRDLFQGGADVPREELLSKMTEVCARAVKVGPRDATAHTVLGLNLNWRGEQHRALAAAEKAIALNPSEAAGYIVAGVALDNMGRSAAAIPHLETGAKLNPNDPRNEIFESITAQANLAIGHYEDAVSWASKALQTREDYNYARVIIASALGHLGRKDEVASAIQLERLGPPQLEPVLILWARYKDPAARERMIEGLRKAGLME